MPDARRSGRTVNEATSSGIQRNESGPPAVASVVDDSWSDEDAVTEEDASALLKGRTQETFGMPCDKTRCYFHFPFL